MKNILNSKKLYRIILIVFLVYCITIIVKQQTKLNSYVAESKYYEDKINSLNEEKQQLLETQEKINTPKYIENVAKEKLEMYLPNEQIFVDINN